MTSPGARSPTVSVIIPAFKASGTIARAIESLLAQTRRPDEIIVVDDGSPDDLVAAVAPYRDRVQLLCKPNGGAASARNLGIAQSRGEWIAFLDADDYWLPTKLDRQLQVLERHPEVGLVAGRFYHQESPEGQRTLCPGDWADLYDRVLKPIGERAFAVATQMWTSSLLVRRDVLGSHRFDEGLKTAEDVDLWARLVLTAPVYLLSEPLATYVLTPDSLSRSNVESDSRNMLAVVRRNAALLGPDGLRWWQAKIYRQWAAGHLGQNEALACLYPAWKRLRLEPLKVQAWWILLKAAVRSCIPWTARRGSHSQTAPATPAQETPERIPAGCS
jgi:glycosyltransferase involved in cell wall biosynthesis